MTEKEVLPCQIACTLCKCSLKKSERADFCPYEIVPSRNIKGGKDA